MLGPHADEGGRDVGVHHAHQKSPMADRPARGEQPRRRRSRWSRAVLALPRAASALFSSAGKQGDAPLRWR
jgi:hypothetical protein